MTKPDGTYVDEVGSAARRNRGQFSGQKIHRLVTTYRDGRLIHCSPVCGCTQGQFAGTPSPRLTQADVTCTKCGGPR